MTRAVRYDFERVGFMLAASVSEELDRACTAIGIERGTFAVQAIKAALARRERGENPFDG